MPAPLPQSPEERARQLSFLQNLLEGEPGLVRKLLHGLTDLPHRASQGEFIEPGGETLQYASQFVAPGIAMAPRGALGMAGSPKLGPSGRPMPIVNKPGLGEAMREASMGAGERGAGQTAAAEAQAQTVLDDVNMTFGSADTRPGTADIGPQIGRLSEFPTTTPRRIINQTKAEGGYSVNLPTGDVPKTGIMAGKFANADPRTRVLNGDPTMIDITDWVKQNEKVLGKPENYVGTWKNEENGKTYLDVSRRFEPDQLRQATKFGEKTGQISLYNVGLPKGDPNRYPPVGNFRQNLVSPEVRARWQEAGKWGEDYMNAQNLPEWWDTPYFRKIYGEKIARENVPGFVGATSTNTRPRPNVQGASEYLRRLIKGEPIIQPDFRVPETAMGGSSGPGKSMGLETGRAGNLRLAAAGETRGSEYSGPVVQEKVNVFSGDPNEAVIDRLQMRPVEDPSRGIYGHSQEATTPEPGKRSSPALPELPPDRELLKQQMLDEATKQGKTLRNFSAQIWAGIRERLKAYGEVWGVKGTAAPDELFSYNDHLIQLVKDKAKHLGISVSEMEKRLGSGDAELLSYLLATPIGAELYRRSRGAQ